MNKILSSLLFFLFITINGICQTNVSLSLQYDGKFAFPNGEHYCVIEKPNMNRTDLYNQLLTSIQKVFNSNNESVEYVENTSITIHGESEKTYVIRSAMGYEVRALINYVISFQVKDGKFRLDAPYIEVLNVMGDKRRDIEKQLSFFKFFKDGKPNNKKEKVVSEMNSDMQKIVNRILNTIVSEDW